MVLPCQAALDEEALPFQASWGEGVVLPFQVTLEVEGVVLPYQQSYMVDLAQTAKVEVVGLTSRARVDVADIQTQARVAVVDMRPQVGEEVVDMIKARVEVLGIKD